MSVFSFGIEVWACAYGSKYLSKIDKFCKRAWTHGYTKKSIFISEVIQTWDKQLLWGKILQIQIHLDRFHKWRPINYSFVNVLIRPTSLVLKEHFFCVLSVLTRLVGLIISGRHLFNRSIVWKIFRAKVLIDHFYIVVMTIYYHVFAQGILSVAL